MSFSLGLIQRWQVLTGQAAGAAVYLLHDFGEFGADLGLGAQARPTAERPWQPFRQRSLPRVDARPGALDVSLVDGEFGGAVLASAVPYIPAENASGEAAAKTWRGMSAALTHRHHETFVTPEVPDRRSARGMRRRCIVEFRGEGTIIDEVIFHQPNAALVAKRVEG